MNRHAMFVLVPAALNGDPRSMTLNELLRDKEPDIDADRRMRCKERVKDPRQILALAVPSLRCEVAGNIQDQLRQRRGIGIDGSQV
jgi:hypothetical protein